MDKLQLALYEYYNGPLVLDLTPYAKDPEFSTGKYGYGYLSTNLTIPSSKAAEIFLLQKKYYIRLGTATIVLFEGRLEDIAIGSEISITAYGYWRAFTDIQVSDLWSSTDVTQWNVLPNSAARSTSRGEDQYTISTEYNRIYIAPNKDITFSGFGMLYYYIPDNTRPIDTIDFFYSEVNPVAANSTIGLQKIDPSTMLAANPNVNPWFVGDALSATHVRVTVAGLFCSGISLYMSHTGLTGTLWVGETGSWNTTFSGLRWGCTPSISGARLYADEVLKYYASGVHTLNTGMLSLDYSAIQTPGYDLKDLQFTDVTGLDAINTLLEYPDSNGQYYEFRIWENQKIFFRPKTQGKTWYVSVGDVQITRSLDTIYTQDRIIYSDRPFRTDFYTLTNRYAIQRQSSTSLDIPSSQVSQAQAAKVADSTNKERFSIVVKTIRDSRGTIFPAYYARSGDLIVLEDIPAYLLNTIDNTFIADETVSDLTTRETTISPVNPSPQLDTLLSRIKL